MRKRQDYFNQAAKNWDREYDTPELGDFLRQFVPAFKLLSGQRVLDVGTGTGILIPFLLEAVGSNGHITAIDYAQNMVEICKRKFSHLPNVSVMVADSENLQLLDASFDVITCFGLFPHLDKKEAALRQFNRVLKSKGRLIIAHALSSTEVKRIHQSGSQEIVSDILPRETKMRRLLKQAGFTGVRILDKPGSYLCTSTKS